MNPPKSFKENEMHIVFEPSMVTIIDETGEEHHSRIDSVEYECLLRALYTDSWWGYRSDWQAHARSVFHRYIHRVYRSVW
jgi:hypothetical protein